MKLTHPDVHFDIEFGKDDSLIGYRDWAPEHEKMGKGVTLTEDEMMKLKELL